MNQQRDAGPGDRPATTDASAARSERGAAAWNLEASQRGDRAAARPLPPGPEATRSIGDLAAALPTKVEGRLAPSHYALTDASGVKLSAAQRDRAEALCQREDLDHAARRDVKAALVGSLLFVRNPDSRELRVVDGNSLGAGWTEQNGNFVSRDANSVQVKPKYPETPEGVERAWRERTNRPLADSEGPTTMDRTQLRRELEANRKLNGWIRGSLSEGKSLSDALVATSRRARDELAGVIVDTVLPLIGPVGSARAR